MLLVKTKLGISNIHGIGIFADESIPKGAMTWKFVPGFDQRFTQAELDAFPPEAREFLLAYAYWNPETMYYVLCSDNARFYNHSKTPNTTSIVLEGTDGEGGEIALCDIQPGDELTVDYREWDDEDDYVQ